MFELNASTTGFDLSIQDSFNFEGIDFNTSKVIIPDLETGQKYEIKIPYEGNSTVPLITLYYNFNWNYDAISELKTISFGDLNGFYYFSEIATHMEFSLSGSHYKSLGYSNDATVIIELSNNQRAQLGVFAPEAWDFDMLLSNIDIDDNRTLPDVIPSKADREEARRKMRSLIESISVKKI